MANEVAVTVPPQHKEVEHFSEAERSEWLKTGEMPLLEEPKKDSSLNKEDSTTSKPVKTVDSGPAKQDKSAEEKEAEKQLNFKALRERTERLEAELDEYKTGKKKVEEKKPDAAATIETGPKMLELPKRPKMSEYLNADRSLDSEKYEAALDKYETDKEAYTNQQVQIRTVAQQMDQIIKQQTTELKTKYGEKSDGLDVKKTMDKLGTTSKDAPAFFMFLNDSEVFTDLLFVLGTDPKIDELLAEAKDPKTMTRAIRKLVALEAGVKAELSKQSKEPVEGEEKGAKKLTSAGKPPLEAAGGSSATDNGSSEAAFRRKDLSVEARGELYRERKNKEDRDKRRKKPN
jgi:hypothetical protein